MTPPSSPEVASTGPLTGAHTLLSPPDSTLPRHPLRRCRLLSGRRGSGERTISPPETPVEAILVASPLLDTLNLSHLDIRGNMSYSEVWVIRGANLRSLTIISYLDFVWHVGELPCLDEAAIDVANYVSCSSFSGFLARFSQARRLALNTCYPSFSGGGLVQTLPCTFNNLKSLTLWTHFYEMPAMVLTFCLLRSAPNLEELEIKIYGDADERCEYLQKTQWTDSFCANLQVVKMKDISWLPNEMYFIELVLSKAIVLRTMHLSLCCKSTKSNEEALCELMTYRRASPHAQVFLDGKME